MEADDGNIATPTLYLHALPLVVAGDGALTANRGLQYALVEHYCRFRGKAFEDWPEPDQQQILTGAELLILHMFERALFVCPN